MFYKHALGLSGGLRSSKLSLIQQDIEKLVMKSDFERLASKSIISVLLGP